MAALFVLIVAWVFREAVGKAHSKGSNGVEVEWATVGDENATSVAKAEDEDKPRHWLKGLALSLLSSKYDCSKDHADWEEEWSIDKMDWCCEHFHLGCPNQRKLPFDCWKGFATWRTSWTEEKKTWCCLNKELGCEAAPSANSSNTSSETQADGSPDNATTTESPAPKDSCVHYGCHKKYLPHHACQCNFECQAHNNCCSDFVGQCVDDQKARLPASTTTGAKPTTLTTSTTWATPPASTTTRAKPTTVTTSTTSAATTSKTNTSSTSTTTLTVTTTATRAATTTAAPSTSSTNSTKEEAAASSTASPASTATTPLPEREQDEAKAAANGSATPGASANATMTTTTEAATNGSATPGVSANATTTTTTEVARNGSFASNTSTNATTTPEEATTSTPEVLTTSIGTSTDAATTHEALTTSVMSTTDATTILEATTTHAPTTSAAVTTTSTTSTTIMYPSDRELMNCGPEEELRGTIVPWPCSFKYLLKEDRRASKRRVSDMQNVPTLPIFRGKQRYDAGEPESFGAISGLFSGVRTGLSRGGTRLGLRPHVAVAGASVAVAVALAMVVAQVWVGRRRSFRRNLLVPESPSSHLTRTLSAYTAVDDVALEAAINTIPE